MNIQYSELIQNEFTWDKKYSIQRNVDFASL